MNAIDLHKKAESARESENFLDALIYSDQALIEYQKEGNIQGFAEILCSRVITLRHLFEQTADQNYLIFAKHTAKAGVEIARKGNDPKALAIPLFNLANVLDQLSEFGEAIENYKEALDHMRENPPPEHSKPSVIHDMTLHLFVCEYKNGDKSALQKAEKALLDLAASEEPNIYAKDVWMSGGYLKIAQMLKNDDTIKAKQALKRAREIINANPSLTLRKKQLDKISATF